MPQTGLLKVLPNERALRFSHTNEVSRPHYYSVMLEGSPAGPLKAEIAAASRCGLLRFTYPESDQARLVIQGINLDPELSDWANDLSPRLKSIKGYVRIDPQHGEITGYNPDRQSAQLGRNCRTQRLFCNSVRQALCDLGHVERQGHPCRGIGAIRHADRGYLEFNTPAGRNRAGQGGHLVHQSRPGAGEPEAGNPGLGF